MIRVVMLDLGGTLEDGTRPFPGVPQSLAALERFVTAAGDPIEYCLVSDFDLAVPFTPENIARRFAEYLEILDGLGLRTFFEPVEKRITLSTHANVLKPDRRVFETALQRLGSNAGLEACLFVTENAAHIDAARSLAMQALRFGHAHGPDTFDSWPDGLVLIAQKIAPGDPRNLQIALEVLGATQDIENISLIDATPDGLLANANAWLPLAGDGPHALGNLSVQFPVTIRVTGIAEGEPKIAIAKGPSEEDKQEALVYVESLTANGQIEGVERSPIDAPTHYIAVSYTHLTLPTNREV